MNSSPSAEREPVGHSRAACEEVSPASGVAVKRLPKKACRYPALPRRAPPPRGDHPARAGAGAHEELRRPRASPPETPAAGPALRRVRAALRRPCPRARDAPRRPAAGARGGADPPRGAIGTRYRVACAGTRARPRCRGGGHSERDDPDTRRLERDLSEALGSATRLDTRAGRLIIEYGGNLRVLEGVLERLGLNKEDW